MSMEKRVFLAFLLSIIVLIVYQTYVVPPPPVTPVTTPAGATSPGASTAAAPSAGGAASIAKAGTPGAVPPQNANVAAPVQTLVADTSARDIVVDTNDIHVVFSSQGAVVKSWVLKKFKSHDDALLDLVPEDLPDAASSGLASAPGVIALAQPFELSTDDADLTARLSKALFRPSADALTLGAESGTLTFEYQDASGVHAKKSFTFQPDHHIYVVTLDAAVDVGGAQKPFTVNWGPGIGPGYNRDGSRESQPASPLEFHDGSIERIGVKEPAQRDVAFKYAGVSDHYFLSAILNDLKERPADSRPLRMSFQPISLPVPKSDAENFAKATKRSLVAYSVTVPGPSSLAYYVGPKDFEVLKTIDPDLTFAIDFGMFRLIVVPLLQALKWVNTWVHNYGWSIIVLTLIMNLLLFPLRHRSMVSMRKMQSLQPEIKAIQERYKKYKLTDPERQKANEETMALYKAKGVNPASGCVPMLLTFPILFAFYSLLACSIELRGAPFMGWLTDLSLRDRYYITPLVMGGTMFWQQRMMPTAGTDPVQQKMFMFMPLIFTYTFLWAPSGLAIYWLTSNLLTIGQQFLTNRLIGAPAPASAVVARVKPSVVKK